MIVIQYVTSSQVHSSASLLEEPRACSRRLGRTEQYHDRPRASPLSNPRNKQHRFIPRRRRHLLQTIQLREQVVQLGTLDKPRFAVIDGTCENLWLIKLGWTDQLWNAKSDLADGGRKGLQRKDPTLMPELRIPMACPPTCAGGVRQCLRSRCRR